MKSCELLADAPNLSQALTTAIAQAFAVELDRTALRGNGSDPEPLGILNTAGIVGVTNGANGAALAGYANFFTAIQSILQEKRHTPHCSHHESSLAGKAGQPGRYHWSAPAQARDDREVEPAEHDSHP